MLHKRLNRTIQMIDPNQITKIELEVTAAKHPLSPDLGKHVAAITFANRTSGAFGLVNCIYKLDVVDDRCVYVATGKPAGQPRFD